MVTMDVIFAMLIIHVLDHWLLLKSIGLTYITTAVQYDRRVFFNIYLYVTAFLQPSYFLYLHYLALKNYES